MGMGVLVSSVYRISVFSTIRLFSGRIRVARQIYRKISISWAPVPILYGGDVGFENLYILGAGCQPLWRGCRVWQYICELSVLGSSRFQPLWRGVSLNLICFTPESHSTSKAKICYRSTTGSYKHLKLPTTPYE